MAVTTEVGTDLRKALQLVLNTWFVMYLHEGERGKPGGLPNDFLSRGSPALLILDDVLCDADALESERAFAGTWLSSDLFLTLEQMGILKPINMRATFSDTFLEHLRQDGWIQAARDMMDAEVKAIRRHHKTAKQLTLSPFITWLNHYMSMGLEIPNALRYEWQEHHFKPPRDYLRKAAQLDEDRMLLEEDIRDLEEEHTRSLRLFKAIGAVLPEFALLPPLPSKGEAADALRKNIAREKPTLYRWVYGDPDMPREKYQELRHGPSYRVLDSKIDEPRKPQAFQNLELLSKVRERTADVRSGVQKIFGDVLEGNRTPEDVKAELEIHRNELISHFAPSHRTITLDVALGGTALALTVAGIISGLAGYPPIIGAAGVGMGAYRFWKSRTRRKEFHLSRRKFPLAWLVRDFEHLQGRQREKLMPRR